MLTLHRLLRNGLVLALAVLVLTGCAAQKHLRKADSAMDDGNMRAALHHYERALSHRESLLEDDDFLEKLGFAQSRVAYEDAAGLRREGHYEAAARELHGALGIDPGYTAAHELLAIVNREAAAARYGLALASADRGHLDAARNHLVVAQQHDAVNEDVAMALGSLRVDALPATTAGLAQYREGLSLAGERRWDAAGGTYREAIGLNRNLLPARAALAESEAQLAESRRLSDSGAARIRESRISAAIPLLEQSIAVWPFNDPAQASLTQARAILAQADEQFAASVAAAEASDWDTAIAAADAGLVLDKAHARLRELRPQLSVRAATDYSQRAEAHIENGELEAARDAYLRALDYKHPHAPAQRGLAGVYHTWGSAHEQAGRPGAALLHYNRGQTYMATADIAQGRSRTLSAIRNTLGMSLSIEVQDTPRGLAVSADRLAGALSQSASRNLPTGFAIDAGQPRFTVVAEVAEASIREQRVGSTNRTHHYRVEELRPNAEYDRLVDCIHDLQREVDRLERDYHSHVGPNHGHHHHDPHTPENRHLNDLVERIDRKQSEIRRVNNQLRRTPRQVLVPIPYTYRYTLETHAKTGTLVIETVLMDNATGEAVEAFTDEASAEHRDTTIPAARPSIGLRDDPLLFPEDGAIANDMAGDVARTATARAIEAAVIYELDRVRAAGAEQLEAGDTEDALETEVAAAVLVGMVDSGASARVIARLVEQHVD